VACDQPFDEVEKEEFIKLITYVHHPATSIKLPGRDGIRRRVMKLGEDTMDGIREMFAVCTLIGSLPIVHLFRSRDLKGNLPYLSMRGPQATNTHFWRLLLIMSQMKDN
jgi:hypothetical protein